MSPQIHLILLLFAVTRAFEHIDEQSQPGSAISDEREPLPWLARATKDWLSDLPDDTDLRHISVPGTHDTGAYTGGILCETQSWSIDEQLTSGIRYFDIRNRRAGTRFDIHHGICNLGIRFEDVLDDIIDFFKAQPRESIFMRVKEEHVPVEGSESFREIWARYMRNYGHLFAPDPGNTLPRLGDIRGKIFVFRNADFDGLGIQYDGPLMDVQDYYQVYRVGQDNPFGGDTVSLDEKREHILRFLQLATRGDKLILNHWSGTNGLFPEVVARGTNEYVYERIGVFMGRARMGIVILDFPGEWLVYRVIKSNFEGRGRCVARNWASETGPVRVEFQIPATNVGFVREIEKGAYGRFSGFICRRIEWSDLRFSCDHDARWSLVGSFGADRSLTCESENDRQPFISISINSG